MSLNFLYSSLSAMVIYRILLVLDWTGQTLRVTKSNRQLSRAIGPPDSDALESGDDLIPHKELVSEERDFPRLFAAAMSSKSRIAVRYVARPLALKQKASRCTLRSPHSAGKALVSSNQR